MPLNAASPAPARSLDQLRAVVRKNLLLKRRAFRTSCCEFVSPALWLGLLVFGYALSDYTYYDAKTYARVELRLGPLVDAVTPFLGGEGDLSINFGGVALGEEANATRQDVDLLALRDSFDALLQGPLPIVPFDLYVQVGQQFQSSLGADSFARLNELESYANLFGNLLTPGTLHLSPNTSSVRAFLSSARAKHPSLRSWPVRLHPDERSATAAILQGTDGERTWGLLHFASLTPRHVDYSIRLNYSTVPNTNLITSWIARGLDTTYQRYSFSGFLTLQALVDEYAFELAEEGGARRVSSPAGYYLAAPMPTAAYRQNIFYQAVSYLLAIILTLCQLFPTAMLTKAIVEEKEMRLKQTMRIMGLRDSVLYVSWWLTALLQFTVIAVLCTIVGSIVMRNTTSWVLFLYIYLFCLGAISFAFLMSVFFSNSVLAAIVTPVVFTGTLLPRYLFYGTNRYEQADSKVAVSLLLPSAFAFGADILGDFEANEVGVSTDNWGQSDYSFLICLQMMALDAILYMIAALYLERVLPSRYGSREHPLFFLFPSWWRSAAHAPPRKAAAQSSPAFEPPPEELPLDETIELVDLHKTYGTGRLKKVAVDGLNLSFYPSQISCLLGHNGAGKTTTFAMLTGLYPPTKGDCYVFGHSISRATRRVYRLLGICPQHDVLYRTLTVAEHLSLYATLKGIPRAHVAAAAAAMMKQVGLPDKAHAASRALSGGMKRKLSVGCALIGGSRAVLLDEPSSGMDPASRRSMWDLLRTAKEGRVLVLTTHYMDEADLLADRIAVLSSGRLRCAGSSLFLKSRFGVGYTLTMVSRGACDERQVRRLVRRHVPTAELLGAHGGELAYRLPFTAAPAFPPLLAEIDAAREELGIGGYGMSPTSLEEVFLRLAEGRVAEGEAEGEEEARKRVAREAKEREEREEWERQDAQELLEQTKKAKAKEAKATPEGAELVEFTPVTPLREAEEEAALRQRLREAVAAEDFDEAARLKRQIESPPPPPPAAPRREEAEEALHGSTPPLLTQLRVMLGKRALCTWRDPKTLVAQHGVPTLLVGLTLLILTIQDPRVGPSLRMGAQMYAATSYSGGASAGPAQFVCNAPRNGTEVLRFLPPSSDVAPNASLNTSLALSAFLLATYNERQDRFGAATLNDTLHVRVSDARLASARPAGGTAAPAGGAIVPPLASPAGGTAGALLLCLADPRPLRTTRRRRLQTAAPPPPPPPAAALSGSALAAAFNEALGAPIAAAFRAAAPQGEALPPAAAELCAAARDAAAEGGEGGGGGGGGGGGLATASLLGGLSELRVDGEPLAEVGARLVEAAVRQALVEAARALFPIDLSPVRAALPTLPPALGIFSPEVAEYNRQVAALDAFAEGGELRLTDFAGTSFQLDDIILANATADGSDARLSNVSVSLTTLTLTQYSLRATNLTLSATLAVEEDETALVFEAGELFLEGNATAGGRPRFAATDVAVYVDGERVFSAAYLSDDTGDAPPPLPDTFELTMPVPLMLLHNASSAHAVAAYLGDLTAAAWAEAWFGAPPPPPEEAPPSYAVRNHPLPLTNRQALQVRIILATLASLFLLVPFCYIPAAPAVFVVKERMSKSKHLQLVAGTHSAIYWLSTYLWDMWMYSLVCASCMVIFLLYDEPAYVGTGSQAFALWSVMMLYGASVIPLVYCYSFLFDNPTTAQISIIMFNLIGAFILVLAHQIMKVIPTTQDADAVLVYFWMLLPGFNFGKAVIDLSTSYYLRELGGFEQSEWDWEVAGRPLVLMFLETFLFGTLVLVIEHSHTVYAYLEPCLALLCGVPQPSLRISPCSRNLLLASFGVCVLVIIVGGSRIGLVFIALLLLCFGCCGVLYRERRMRKTGSTSEAIAANALAAAEGGLAFHEEEDVAAERRRVEELLRRADRSNVVLLQNLRKVFPPRGKATSKVAVVDLSLAIPPAECFGFLGVNGAGKTTTLSILTGDFLPTSGRAWIAGRDVVSERTQVQQRMGYCPQVDPLIELMTARETLVMFARLKNLPSGRIGAIVDDLLERVTLTPYADRVCGSYSGGNKRKLSLAIALVGSPAVVFLDEPSSGMDPLSRRHMWDIITRERKVRSIVLTTHSMEECEALCTRIGIMTAGRFQCLGSQQHLKSKYGGGYTLELRVARHAEAAVGGEVAALFPAAILVSAHAGKFKYELPMKSTSLATVFELMESNKERLGVLDYSASQPTLESIFLSIAEKDINRTGGAAAEVRATSSRLGSAASCRAV